MNRLPERNEQFGRWLRAARVERGLSQTELALAVGRTQSHVAKWEQGLVSALSLRLVRDLAHALHLPPAAVVEAFGYPVRKVTVITPPLTNEEAMERAEELSLRLSREVNAWMFEIFPGEEEEQDPQRNGHSG